MVYRPFLDSADIAYLKRRLDINLVSKGTASKDSRIV